MYMRVVLSLLILVGSVIAVELGILARIASRQRIPTSQAARASVPLDNQPAAADTILDRVIPNIDIRSMPLAEAMAEFERQAKVEVDARPGVLTADQLQTPVSIHLHEVTVAAALSCVVDQVNPKPPFWVRGGIVLIGDEGDIDTRLYDVRALVSWSYPPAAGPATDKDRPDGIDELINLITTFVAPESWNANGGTGSIRSWGGILVVSQTQAHHREVARLLARLSPNALRVEALHDP